MSLAREASLPEDDMDISELIAALKSGNRPQAVAPRWTPAPAPCEFVPASNARPWPRWYSPPRRGRTSRQVIEWAARRFCVAPEAITGPSKSIALVHARAVIASVLRRWGWSFPRIGQTLGNRDHSSIINSAERMVDYTKRHPEFGEIVADAHLLFAPVARKHG